MAGSVTSSSTTQTTSCVGRMRHMRVSSFLVLSLPEVHEHAPATQLRSRVQALTGQADALTGRPALSFGVHRLLHQAADSYNVKHLENVRERNTEGGARAWET